MRNKMSKKLNFINQASFYFPNKLNLQSSAVERLLQGAETFKEYTNWDSLMEDSITVYECPICGMRYFDKELTIKDQTHILKPKSEWSKESGNYKKDFVGAIWGYEAWYDLYFGHLEAGEDLGEGNMSDLVTRLLHSCKDYYVKIIFLGVFSGHSLGISSKIWFTSLKDPPPEVLEQINEAKMQDSFSHDNIFKEGLP